MEGDKRINVIFGIWKMSKKFNFLKSPLGHPGQAMVIKDRFTKYSQLMEICYIMDSSVTKKSESKGAGEEMRAQWGVDWEADDWIMLSQHWSNGFHLDVTRATLQLMFVILHCTFLN